MEYSGGAETETPLGDAKLRVTGGGACLIVSPERPAPDASDEYDPPDSDSGVLTSPGKDSFIRGLAKAGSGT